MSGRDASAAGADAAHDNSVGQPHTEAESDVIVAAEKGAAQISSPAHPLGEAGPRFNRASPFMIGMAGAAGVAVTYGVHSQAETLPPWPVASSVPGKSSSARSAGR